MKKVQYGLIALAFIGALLSMILAISNSENWTWQFIALCWIANAFINQKIITKSFTG